MAQKTLAETAEHYQAMADEAAGVVRLPNGFNLTDFVKQMEEWEAVSRRMKDRTDRSPADSQFHAGEAWGLRLVIDTLRTLGGVK
jgi:hypothetical protein